MYATRPLQGTINKGGGDGRQKRKVRLGGMIELHPIAPVANDRVAEGRNHVTEFAFHGALPAEP